MCKIIAIANQKGGVAKTTTTINLGVGLSKVGKRVMLIDADPQGHLTMGLGFPKNLNAASVDSADLVGQAAGDSGRTVQRYIRLTCLIPELLKLLDEGKINFTVGVSLTYLSETEQIWVKDCIVSGASSVTGSMATKLKQYSDEGNLTELAVQLILNEKKTETGKVTLTEKKIRKYFPKEYNREQIEQVIYELLDNWKKSQ